MSRLPKEDVWLHIFGSEVDEEVCPCCKITVIHKAPSKIGKKGKLERDWHKGHIIPDREKRFVTSVLINMRPLCITCNGKDRWPEFKSNYHYSEHLSVLQSGQADLLYAALSDELENIRQHPEIIECDTEGCRHLKRALSNFCKVCSNKHAKLRAKEIKDAAAVEAKIEKEFDKLIQGVLAYIPRFQKHIETYASEANGKEIQYMASILLMTEKFSSSFRNVSLVEENAGDLIDFGNVKEITDESLNKILDDILNDF